MIYPTSPVRSSARAFGFETDRGYDRILRRYFRRNFIGGRDGNPIYDIDSFGEKPLYGTCRGIHRAGW